jgi:hypothetical protein
MKATTIKPIEVRGINQEEIETIISHLKEIDEYFDAEIEANTRKDFAQDFTKVFVFSFGVYVLSVNFHCMNIKEVGTNKNSLVLDHMKLEFFIKNNGECCEVLESEFLDIIS